MAKFECTRCGGCCKEILNGESGRLFGLYLDPSERDLFPSELVFPLLGSGDPIEISAYQLGVNRCPHYEETGGMGTCRIREKRPAACRAFPVLSRFTLSTRCNSVRKNPEGFDRDSLGVELAAHDEKLRQMVERPKAEWIWSLDLRRWIPLEATP